MAKITLTEEEEIMYLRELDKLQDMMPDLEIQILPQSLPYNASSFTREKTDIGNEFKAFLHTARPVSQPSVVGPR